MSKVLFAIPLALAGLTAAHGQQPRLALGEELRRQEIETPLRQFHPPLADQPRLKLFLQPVQVQHIRRRIFLLRIRQLGGTPIATLLRILRLARLFRVVKANAGLQRVIRAIIYATPQLFNVMGILMLLWFIFSIVGMQVLSGTRYGHWAAYAYREGQTQPWLNEGLPLSPTTSTTGTVSGSAAGGSSLSHSAAPA